MKQTHLYPEWARNDWNQDEEIALEAKMLVDVWLHINDGELSWRFVNWAVAAMNLKLRETEFLKDYVLDDFLPKVLTGETSSQRLRKIQEDVEEARIDYYQNRGESDE